MNNQKLVWKYEINEWVLAQKNSLKQEYLKKDLEKLIFLPSKQQNIRQIGTLVLTSEGIGILQQQINQNSSKNEISVKINQVLKKFNLDELIFEIPINISIYHNDIKLTIYKIHVPIYTTQEILLKNIEGLIFDALNIDQEDQQTMTPSFKAYHQHKELESNNQQISGLNIAANSKILVISSNLSIQYTTLVRYTSSSYWCYGDTQVLIESTTISFSKNVTFMGFGLFSFKEYNSTCPSAGQTVAYYMVRFFKDNNVKGQPFVEMKFSVPKTPEAQICPCIFKKPIRLVAQQKYICQIENCQGGHSSFYGTGGKAQYDEEKVTINFENTPEASYTQFSTVQIPEIYYSVN